MGVAREWMLKLKAAFFFAAPVVLVGYCFDANTPFFLTLLVFAAKLFLKSFLIFNYFFTVFFSLMCCYPK
jgi:hypothetical protein